MKTAVLVVDVQNDFCEGGALAVVGGLAIVGTINKLIRELGDKVLVVASQDFHPLNHCSFDNNGGTWPVHCIQNTKGADIVDGLELPEGTVRIYKGQFPEQEAYSPFDGITVDNRLLNHVLAGEDVDHIYVCGIALNFCVRATVLDALRLGYKVTLVENATVGIPNVDPSPTATLEELAAKGCQFMKVG